MSAIASRQSATGDYASTVTRGAIGGLIGGMGMAMLSMVVAISEDGFWAPVRGITSVVFGDKHYGGGFEAGPVLVGLMGHMMNSAILGIVFALVAATLLSKLSRPALVAAGVAFGLGVWAVMIPGVAAQAQSSELFVDSVPAWTWIVGHMMFGGLLAGVLALKR